MLTRRREKVAFFRMTTAPPALLPQHALNLKEMN
jgi:hypothetical protein